MSHRPRRKAKLLSGHVWSDLLSKIRIDGDGVAFDDAEASALIARLERCDIVDVDRAGDTFTVTMEVPGGTVVHKLRMPTQTEVQRYARSSVSRREERRSIISTVSLRPGGELYDQMILSSEGYAGAVPITHKDAAVVEVLSSLDESEESPEA